MELTSLLSEAGNMSRASAVRQESLATPAEVAAYLGGEFSEKTLANWRSAGKGPLYVKLGGGRVRYRWSAVNAWVDEQSKAGAS
jgi:predicted DNA-binding transcriptional regulator AlpA